MGFRFIHLTTTDSNSRNGIFKADQNSETHVEKSEFRILPFFSIPPLERHSVQNQILLASLLSCSSHCSHHHSVWMDSCRLCAGTACLTTSLISCCSEFPCFLPNWCQGELSLVQSANSWEWCAECELWRVADDKNWEDKLLSISPHLALTYCLRGFCDFSEVDSWD